MKTLIKSLSCVAVAICSLSAVSVCCAAPGDPVLVEAESLATKGGWVVDQQFMDQMGSPFLLTQKAR